MISAVVLTKNEEKKIGDCLKSLAWCDEVVVIDDGSTDKTLEMASKNGAHILKHAIDDNFARQRNFALEKAKGSWVFFVDSDEIVTAELAQEIKETLKQEDAVPTYDGFYIQRKDFVFGTWLAHGEVGDIKLLRLGKKDAGKWIKDVHEVWNLPKAGILATPLLHYPHQDVAQFLEHINTYSTIYANSLKKAGKKGDSWEIVAYPAAKFIRNYFVLMGFLDGVPGLLHATFMSLHSFLTRGKLWLLTHEVQQKKR